MPSPCWPRLLSNFTAWPVEGSLMGGAGLADLELRGDTGAETLGVVLKPTMEVGEGVAGSTAAGLVMVIAVFGYTEVASVSVNEKAKTFWIRYVNSQVTLLWGVHKLSSWSLNNAGDLIGWYAASASHSRYQCPIRHTFYRVLA
jgi:hypothetical protein